MTVAEPAAMEADWLRLLSHYSVARPRALPVFHRLKVMYSEQHRSYHTLEHISEMLSVVRRLAEMTMDRPAVELAVWFHDAVYDSRSAENEELSASFADDRLRSMGLSPELRDRVARMIWTTAHDGPFVVDPDTAVLLDADLAILGALERRYAEYAAGIRREYSWVEDAAYRAGRARVLEGFLARPRIYRTEQLHAQFEETARRNLNAEVRQLLGPITS